MFKRRLKPRGWEALRTWFYPRGGWSRAMSYLSHRLRRLPDSSQKIARGIAAGVFASFTPLFGFHFLLAAAFAWVVRGNILASLIATFAGNPLTFPLIATASLTTGRWLLGDDPEVENHRRLARAFADAMSELWRVLGALFTDEPVHLARLRVFFDDLFLPYLIGGILPGLAAALVFYFVSEPLIRAYQRRRREKFRARLEQRLAKALAERREELKESASDETEEPRK